MSTRDIFLDGMHKAGYDLFSAMVEWKRMMEEIKTLPAGKYTYRCTNGWEFSFTKLETVNNKR